MAIDRYTREREIGRGGMGAVWLARDEVLGRQVAMKRLGWVAGAASPDRERAEREARLAAMLNHPHVVAVFDRVQEGDDTWLVMEYVEGESLAQRLRRGPMRHEDVVPVMAQCADALLAAHEAGIVHRDVKPSNILLSTTGEAKLGDFGIARATSDPSLTQTGMVTGSPAYLAPEVAAGRSARPASDVWSLGATLHHALSGAPPYEMDGNLIGGLYRIVHEEPPRLATAGDLAPLLEGTMTKDPGSRWSMRQVRDHLVGLPAGSSTQLMAPAPTPAPTPEPTPEPPPSPRRRRGPVFAWLVVAAVMLVLLLVGWQMMTGPDTQPPPTAGNGTEPRSPGTSATQEPPEPRKSQKPEKSEKSKKPRESSSPERPTRRETEAAMEDFVSSYLAAAPSGSRTAYQQLTPAFQSESGGYGGYHGFWSTIESASLQSVTADPDALTVSYDVHYVKTDGTELDDSVQLQLVRSGDGFKIAGEA